MVWCDPAEPMEYQFGLKMRRDLVGTHPGGLGVASQKLIEYSILLLRRFRWIIPPNSGKNRAREGS
jgi:hypothetical protein